MKYDKKLPHTQRHIITLELLCGIYCISHCYRIIEALTKSD